MNGGNFTMVGVSCNRWNRSGYMVYILQKKKMDNEFIEKEGEVYMKRLAEERET